jgi:long-subunit acyl-CoA synthetase (AMP-forming)
MVLGAAERGDDVALSYPQAGTVVEVSYRELSERARSIARGMIALGIEPGDRVSILGSTRADWTLCDLGALCARGGRRADLPRQLTGGVRACARALRREAGVLRGRPAGREDRGDSRSLP